MPAPGDRGGSVLDASALLAFLHDEPGGDQVEGRLAGAVVSAVNWSEVVQKARQHGVSTSGLRGDMEALGLRIEPFGVDDAERTAKLWEATRTAGLSLADRACLALGVRLERPVVTADRRWRGVGVQVEVDLVR